MTPIPTEIPLIYHSVLDRLLEQNLLHPDALAVLAQSYQNEPEQVSERPVIYSCAWKLEPDIDDSLHSSAAFTPFDCLLPMVLSATDHLVGNLSSSIIVYQSTHADVLDRFVSDIQSFLNVHRASFTGEDFYRVAFDINEAVEFLTEPMNYDVNEHGLPDNERQVLEIQHSLRLLKNLLDFSR